MTRSVDFCDWVAFVCWADFDGVFSPDRWPNFVTCDVAGVTITRGGRDRSVSLMVVLETRRRQGRYGRYNTYLSS